MEWNRSTLENYNIWHDLEMDNAGWTVDEKINGKFYSFNYNHNTDSWDIPNTTVKTTALFSAIQNPDLSDDYIFLKQTDTLTVLDQATYNSLMDTWFPDE